MEITMKEGDIIICTVNKIEGTTVFVSIEDSPTSGTIVFSEIAAGRIRNIREYVVPNKKIVCKVLKIFPDHIELSFRRVTGSERDSIMEKYKQEQTFKTMLKKIVENPEEAIKKIKSKLSLQDFFAKIKENQKIITEFIQKPEAEKLQKILSEKKEKDKEIRKIFILKSDASSGLKDIIEILNKKDAEIRYLGSSQFSISAKAKNFKEANQKVDSALSQIQQRAKDRKAHFELKEKQ